MSTTITLTKVVPRLGGADQTTNNIGWQPGSDTAPTGKMYVYECQDNGNPALTHYLISPTANLLTPGSNHTSGTNTGTIVITDTPG